MRTIKNFFLPLLALPFFYSCQKVSYTVNADEMLDAFIMKGEKYLQARIGEGNYNAFTPTSYHHIYKEGSSSFYMEKVKLKRGEKCYEYTRDDPNGEFILQSTEATLDTISDFVNWALEPIKQKKYEDFDYHKDSKEYFVNCNIEEEECTVAIRFVNKKVTYFDRWESSKTRDNAERIAFEHKKVNPPII